MKTSLRKLVATVSGLAIAAVLPATALMASAEGDTSLTIAADKTYVQAGDIVKVSFVSDGITAENGWNLLEFGIGYDAAQVAPEKQLDEEGDPYEYATGAGITAKKATIDINFAVNPVLGAVISSDDQTKNGEILNVAFKVAEGVKDGDKITLSVDLKAFNHSVVENQQVVGTVALEEPGVTQIELTVGSEPVELDYTGLEKALAQVEDIDEKAYTEESLKKLADAVANAKLVAADENATQADIDAAAKAVNDAYAALVKVSTDPSTKPSTDPSTKPSTEPTVAPTDDSNVVVTDPTVDNGNGTGTGAQTGESTTLFVLALVLMAGSAVALVGMKKKVFSK